LGWDRTTIWGLLKNPAYEGQAAFGKTRAGELRPRLREHAGRRCTLAAARSSYDQPPEHWLSIPVPALVDAALFATVQAQLEENRRRTRSGRRGAKYLLQGLLVCGCCGYAFYGKADQPQCPKTPRAEYAYYRCGEAMPTASAASGSVGNKPLRTDRLEAAVWNEVGRLLAEPARLAHEYQRRLDAVQAPPAEADAALVDQQIAKLRQGHCPLDRRVCRGLSRPSRSGATDPALSKSDSKASKPKPSNYGLRFSSTSIYNSSSAGWRNSARKSPAAWNNLTGPGVGVDPYAGQTR